MQVDRRSFMGAVGALGAMSMARERATARTAMDRPNILFIMADDLGYADLSCTGSHHINTPAIDSIGVQGIQLRQGYANSWCCQSNRNLSPIGAPEARSRLRHAARFCHSASAAERRVL
jgi:hypothetical protein